MCELLVASLPAMVQALHLFKKAEMLLETMNKELDKSRVMSNRPARHAIQRSSSISPQSAPQTPGPTLVPVSRVRHARYEAPMHACFCLFVNVWLVSCVCPQLACMQCLYLALLKIGCPYCQVIHLRLHAVR